MSPMNQRGSSESVASLNARSNALIPLIIEQHPRTALRVQQRLELLDRCSYARTQTTGAQRRHDVFPIEIVHIDNGRNRRRERREVLSAGRMLS